MHFSHLNDGTGGKAGRVALVAGLHVLVAMGVIQTMNSKTISLPAMVEDKLVWIKPDIPPPSPPPEPPKPQTKVAPPEIVVPKVEVAEVEPPPEPTVSATLEAQPQPAEPMQSAPSDAPPAEPSANSGQMRSAVLADANGCAKPDYPARAARNGETGTVTLALMVGADGRVKDSRIQSSSGSRELDRAAVNALSLCQFKPAMNNGVAEAGWAQLAYVWTLE
ncbi:energy transducer TonB [Massilia sp. ST3]|uniref:energy transducer TonB n=1 Tax=Massilia sp. ST3 TaxID=2824903 RepID=UPI001B83111C|nr:energy transducer TonB [Massilia sp. ST3]MBQ5946171.1 TonB family protein [Massilia sp. ST3]